MILSNKGSSMYDVHTGGRGGCDKMGWCLDGNKGVDFPIKMWTSTGEGGRSVMYIF